MLRNLFGFAVLAVVTMFVLKIVFALFGLALGLVVTAAWLAFVGFIIYLVLKIFAPGAAARVRELIAGH
jgi:hypothetical protein